MGEQTRLKTKKFVTKGRVIYEGEIDKVLMEALVNQPYITEDPNHQWNKAICYIRERLGVKVFNENYQV